MHAIGRLRIGKGRQGPYPQSRGKGGLVTSRTTTCAGGMQCLLLHNNKPLNPQAQRNYCHAMCQVPADHTSMCRNFQEGYVWKSCFREIERLSVHEKTWELKGAIKADTSMPAPYIYHSMPALKVPLPSLAQFIYSLAYPHKEVASVTLGQH